MTTVHNNHICHNKVLDILNTVYEKVQSLEEFCISCTNNDVVKVNSASVLQSTDKRGYERFMKTSMVGSPFGQQRCRAKLSDMNELTQSEVVVQAIERIKKRAGKEKNLLTFGCSSMSNNPNAQVCGSVNFEYSFPNQNISSLLQPNWKLLLARIGDEKMLHLLESRAIFMAVNDTCYIQLTGVPLYETLSCNKSMKCTIAKKIQRSKSYRYEEKTSKKNGVKFQKIPEKNKDNCGKRKLSDQQNHYQQSSAGSTASTTKRIKLSINHEPELDETFIQYEHDLNSAFCDFDSEADEVMEINKGMVNETFQESIIDETLSIVSACDNTLYVTSLEEQESSESYMDISDDISDKLSVKVEVHNTPGKIHNTPVEIHNASSEIHNISGALHNMSGTICNTEGKIDKTSHQNVDQKCQSNSNKPCTISDKVSAVPTKLDVLCNVLRNTKPKELNKEKIPMSQAKPVQPLNQPSKTIEFQPYKYHTYFNRTKALYSKNMKESFPQNHILEQNRYDQTSLSKKIINDIMKVDVTGSNVSNVDNTFSNVKSIALIQERLIPVVGKLIESHRKCNYTKILSYYTPLPKHPSVNQNPVHSRNTQSRTLQETSMKPNTIENRGHKEPGLSNRDRATSQRRRFVGTKKTLHHKQKSVAKLTLQELLGCHISSRQTFLLMRRLYMLVVPTEILGSKYNETCMLKAVRSLLQLGRFEKMCLGKIVSTIKISQCKWLPKKLPYMIKEMLVAKVIFWLMETYVLVILKSFLYITETSVFRNRLFYYRKSVWKRISQKAISVYLKKEMLKEIPESFVKSAIQKGMCLGIANLRFMPKTASVRPIVNMNRKVLWGPSKGSTINRQLQNLLQVLTYEKERNPNFIGSSQFGASDIHKSWRQFVKNRIQNRDERPLYFVKVDIENCYDSIDQTKLYKIIEESLNQSDQEYVIRRYSTVYLSSDQVKHIFQREVTKLGEFDPDFYKYVRKKCVKDGKRDTVFVDQVMHMHETRNNLLSKLRNHLFCNVIQIGKKYYRQMIGIGQGSILSTMLCSYYYGNMEKELVHLDVKEELLLRQVDDFLLATPYIDKAIAFLHLMLYGIETYNCKVSRQKSLVNFKTEEPDVAVNPSQALFAWCGLLIHPLTLEVVTDYTRYTGLKVTDILTFELSQQVGEAMKTKLQQSLPQKNQMICLDPDINSDDTLVLTIYKIFLMVAYKFHINLKKLSHKQGRGSEFLMDVILSLPPHLFHQISYKYYKSLNSSRRSNVLTLGTMKHICLIAFKVKLTRHQGMYGGKFIKELNSQLKQINRKQKEQSMNYIEELLKRNQEDFFKLF